MPRHLAWKERGQWSQHIRFPPCLHTLQESLFLGLFGPTSLLITLWLAPPPIICEASLDLLALISEPRSWLAETEDLSRPRSPEQRWLPPPLIRLVNFSALASIAHSEPLCWEDSTSLCFITTSWSCAEPIEVIRDVWGKNIEIWGKEKVV